MTTLLQRRARTYAPKQGAQTHLLYIHADDVPPMEWSQDYYGQYAPTGGTHLISAQRLYARTPRLNYFARNGMQYTRATGACVCSPGRAGTHTGEFAYAHGLGTIVRGDYEGEAGEFADPGFDGGTPLATALAATCQKAFIGKMHLSLDAIDNPGIASEYTIINKSTEPSPGRMGDWDKRVVVLNNHNNKPVPEEDSAGPQDDDVGQSTTTDGSSYYFYRYRDELQEANEGNLGAPTPAGGNEFNSDGQYSASKWVDEALEFFNGLTSAQRGFCYLSVNSTHAPFDAPPVQLTHKGRYPQGAANGWRRMQQMIEALDTELGRLWDALPPSIRNNLVIIFAADNGVDETFLDDMIGDDPDDEGLDAGPQWADINDLARGKQSIYRYGVGVQMFAFGPGIVAGTCSGMVEAPVDVYQTICAYFGATAGATSEGISIIPTWDGSKTFANWTRQSTYHSLWYPNGSPDAVAQPEFDPKAAWADATAYVVDQERHHDGDVYSRNFRCTANHTSIAGTGPTGNEPGVGPVWQDFWAEIGRRDIGFTRRVVTADATSETLGTYKLVRRLCNSAETYADTDELYLIYAADGTDSDIYEETNVVATAPNTYALLVSEMEAQQGGFE